MQPHNEVNMPIILLKMLSELDNLGLQLDCSAFSSLLLFFHTLIPLHFLRCTELFLLLFHFLPSRPPTSTDVVVHFLMILKKKASSFPTMNYLLNIDMKYYDHPEKEQFRYR